MPPSSRPAREHPPAPPGFTLIEVIVAVCILAIGMTVILRYFLYVSSAVDTLETDTEAGRFLEATIDRLNVELLTNKTLPAAGAAGTTEVNNHPASWEWSYVPVDMNITAEPGQVAPPDSAAKDRQLQNITVCISWRQSNREQRLRLERYAVIKNESEEAPQ
jgi:prepilin-type N-terminal cleavage/methylation domain-containing protein